MITSVLEIIFWGSVIALAYVYLGYPLILVLARASLRDSHTGRLPTGWQGPVSVVLAVHNEESVIHRRLMNIFAQGELVREVIIGSDGSSDETVRIAGDYPDNRVTVLEFPQQRGRALVHNDCIQVTSGDFVVFTDADTEFKPGCLEALTRPFAHPDVAVTTGTLVWRSDTCEEMGIYWKMEMILRGLESDLHLLATASGPFMAIRRSCYERLLPDEDVDFSTPLQAIRKGYRVVHVRDALATDEEAASQFRARRRMVSKNIVGTLRELIKTNPLIHPGLWWSALSHKILRWFTPVFVMLVFVAVFGPGMEPYRPWILLCYGTGALAVLIGGAAEFLRLQVPGVSLLWKLAVVNVGMFAGLLHAARGQRISMWQA